MRPRLSTIRKQSARILAATAEKISKVLLETQVHPGPTTPGSLMNGSLLPN